MKVALALLSLILVVSCTAEPYELKCTRNEMGILWPNYDDTTQYYYCMNVRKAVSMTCNSGLLFTFVYQSCTLQSDYIPAPPLENLPTDPPTGSGTTEGGSTGTTPPPFTLPTPQTPDANSTTPASTTSTTVSTTKSTTSSTTSTSTTKTTPTSTSTSTTTASPPTPPTPSGGVPNPPSPPATDIPMPSTPAATPPVIDVSPPNAPSTVPSSV